MAKTLLLACVLAAALGADNAEGRISAPSGVSVSTAVSGVPHPVGIAVDRRGGIWLTSAGEAGTAPSDGLWYAPRPAARPRRVVADLHGALGLLWHRGWLYVSHAAADSGSRHTGRVTAYGGFDGKRFRRRRTVVTGIPIGVHSVDSLAAGPDGRLYLGVGSQTNADRPTARLSAGVISFRPGGSRPRVEASGLRNPFGLAFIPNSSTLIVSDEGRDDLGPDRPPEELNAIDIDRPARDFGHPDCFDQGGPACRGKAKPLVELPAHAAVGGVVVARRFGKHGQSAFVTEFGSNSAAKPAGGLLVRVPLTKRPLPRRLVARRFLTGFRLRDPLGVAAGPRGALYVTLWSSGRVLRVTAPPRAASRLSLGGLAELGRNAWHAVAASLRAAAGLAKA